MVSLGMDVEDSVEVQVAVGVEDAVIVGGKVALGVVVGKGVAVHVAVGLEVQVAVLVGEDVPVRLGVLEGMIDDAYWITSFGRWLELVESEVL